MKSITQTGIKLTEECLRSIWSVKSTGFVSFIFLITDVAPAGCGIGLWVSLRHLGTAQGWFEPALMLMLTLLPETGMFFQNENYSNMKRICFSENLEILEDNVKTAALEQLDHATKVSPL